MLTGVQENQSTTERPSFSVEVQHRRAWNSEVAMTEHVWLNFHGRGANVRNVEYSIYMSIADPPQGQGMPSRINTQVIEQYGNSSRPITVNEMRNAEFIMINYGNRVTVSTWFGVELEYVAYNWALDVYIPDCYNDVMEGLCGNYNGNPADDYNDRNGTKQSNVVTWAQTWKTEGGDENCEAGPESFPECTDPEVIKDCSLLLDDTGIFEPCLNTNLPAETFYDNCMFDYCLDRSMKCGIIGQYAQSCFRELAGVMTNDLDICNWATITGCAPTCGPNSIYTGCASSCRDTKTCSNKNDTFDHCPENDRFVSMCICNDGFVLENGECIREEDCGCITSNGASVSNGFKYNGCKEHCVCSDSVYVCTPHTEGTCVSGCGCDEPKSCILPNDSLVSNGHQYEDCHEQCECFDGNYECTKHADGTCLPGCSCNESK